MIKSPTIKLSSWYLLILMLVSAVFSISIYQVASNELSVRLEQFQSDALKIDKTTPVESDLKDFRYDQLNQAGSSLLMNLIYVNVIIFFVGGLGSYILARKNIRPIEIACEEESRFTSDASHELRTPLAVMKTEIEVALRDKSATNKDLRQVLGSNLEEVDKLSKLAEMLLNLSRLDNAKLKMKLLNLNVLTQEIINNLKIPKTRIKLSSPKRITAIGNEAALLDLIKVLVENALQYSPQESLIEVKLSSKESISKFEIINKGKGIDSKDLPHIFDRFYRADSSRTCGTQKSYGIGLALAKKIIELHNGELSAYSEPNKKTAFTFEIPNK